MMKPFAYHKALDVREAVSRSAANVSTAFIAGGTDLLQLWRIGAVQPDAVIDLTAVGHHGVRVHPDRLVVGALTPLQTVAADAAVVRECCGISEALLASASPQIRNMATVGGNLLQRTRCVYFRTEHAACNQRTPGSGCPARTGVNRGTAIFGWDDDCVAVHPSDLAVALNAFDATLRLAGGHGERSVRMRDFYLPGRMDTALQPGEVITQVEIPRAAGQQRSTYVKVRDRASFEFALVSLCAVIEWEDGVVSAARLTAGGVAARPWRLAHVERALAGRVLDQQSIARAAGSAADGARPLAGNGFKVRLLQRVVARALTRLEKQ
jgi:xanthine dehydrogenase YagS FAD-binding subunit